MKKIDLEALKQCLPQYAESITEKRKYGKYNCPICGSGKRENGTPAFNLYQDNTKAHCFSCGFDGSIIDLYLAYHKTLCYEIINQGRTKPALFRWGEFNSITADDLTTAARSGKKLTDIANDKHDDEEDREIAIEVIKNIAIYGKEISISYERFRKEIENDCGVDFLPKKPAKFMNSLLSDLRACGIGIELKKVKGILETGEHDTIARKGFVIRYMTDGYLMADAMPNRS